MGSARLGWRDQARRGVVPGALLLITTTQGRTDPRLFNEILDWLWVHGESVNVQRLKNIQKALGPGDRRVLGAIDAWLGQRSTLSKLKPLAAISEPGPRSPRE